MEGDLSFLRGRQILCDFLRAEVVYSLKMSNFALNKATFMTSPGGECVICVIESGQNERSNLISIDIIEIAAGCALATTASNCHAD